MNRPLAPAFVLALLACFSPPAHAQGQPIIFSAMGDVPYAASEVPILQQQILDQNRYSPSEFMVHVGDIKSGSSSCVESVYRDMSGYLQVLTVPTYIIPGDNEYNDCGNVAQAWSWWQQYFTDFENHFCGTPPTEHQSVRHENFAFVRKGVLFIGINLVGGAVQSSSEWSQRLQQDADWVRQQFQSKVGSVRAAVVFSQAGPGRSDMATFFTPFRQAAAGFVKPILFLHGDGHTWKMDHPWPEANVLRIQVVMGGKEDPVQVTVTLDPQNPWQILRKPFSGSPVVFNMPPCVAAGSDLSVALPASAALQGQATDDGDPASPGSLAFAWSAVSGPGTVTFANPAARSTTAGFSAPGSYVLRLTADDGQLQASDEISVAVSGPLAGLTISDVRLPEGNAGASDATFTVTLNGGNGQPVSVDYTTTPGSASATSDYQPAAGTLTFAAGTTTQTIHVSINGDTQAEPDESFFVDLTHATNAAIVDGRGQGTIVNDDAVQPAAGVVSFDAAADGYVSVANPSSSYGSAASLRVRSGNSGYSSYLRFTVQGLAGSVQSAKLRLYVTDAGPNGGSVYAVSNTLAGSTSLWTEQNLTAAKAPVLAGVPIAAVGAANAKKWVEVDVTAAVTGNGTYNFGIVGGTTNTVYYGSREASKRPVLVITTGSVVVAQADLGPSLFTSRDKAAPDRFELLRTSPNPTRGRTVFEYGLPHAGNTRCVIYNARGEVVRTLARQAGRAGVDRLEWDGRDAAGRAAGSGIYFYDLEFDRAHRSGKIVLQR